MTRAKTIALNANRPVLRMQEALLRCAATIIAVFGGWRSGKTRGCALKFLANCLANPWRPEYGNDHPFSLVIGMTRAVLRDSGYRELLAIIPPEAILYVRNAADDWHLMLTNGHVIKFKTAAGAVEGASACGVWLDEAHLLTDESTYLNYQMRASDALARRFLVLVSGLPESGWLQDTFDREEHRTDPTRALFRFRTAENIYNPPHVIAQFRASASKQSAKKYLEGEWMPRDGAIYYEWDPRVHLVADDGDRNQHVHVGIDIGEKGAIIIFQERVRTLKLNGKTTTGLGLHVVDEILPENVGTREAMLMLRSRGWRLDPTRSLFCVDPTARGDELAAIRSVFFGEQTRIIKKTRGTDAETVDYGIDCVNVALRDVDDNVRLTLSNKLPQHERSLRTAIPKYHRKNGKPVRDNIIDHALDGLRYPVAHLLPLARALASAA